MWRDQARVLWVSLSQICVYPELHELLLLLLPMVVTGQTMETLCELFLCEELDAVKQHLYTRASSGCHLGSISWDTDKQLDMADWFMADLDWQDEILWLLLLGGVRENNGVRLIHFIPQNQNKSPRICKWSKGPSWRCLVCRTCPEPLPTTAVWRNGCSKILSLAFVFGIS